MSTKSSGHVGVAWHKGINKWIAYINIGGHRTYLGNFENLEDAISAREKAESNFVRPKGKIASEKEQRLADAERERSHYKNADMSKLSVDQRAYLLDYLNGMRAQDIADKYGVNKPVVYSRIREAKRLIDTGFAHRPEEITNRKKYARKYYQEHKEQIKEQASKYAAEHPDEVRQTQKQSYKRNRKQRIEYMKQYNKHYYQKNRDRILARAKERRQKRLNDTPGQ